jgi:sigma-E factor negative regulatory protein RseC
MIEEAATVVAAAEGLAWVETTRRSACGHCQQARSCGAGNLATLFRPGQHRLRITDPAGLRAGERVSIGIAPQTLIRAALTAYLLPLVTLVAAAGVGAALALPEGAIAGLGLAGLGAGLGLAGWLTGGASARARYRPVLTRRLSDG